MELIWSDFDWWFSDFSGGIENVQVNVLINYFISAFLLTLNRFRGTGGKILQHLKSPKILMGQALVKSFYNILTYFMPLALFYTPWKYHKTRGSLMLHGAWKETSGMKWLTLQKQQKILKMIENLLKLFFSLEGVNMWCLAWFGTICTI